MSSPRFAIILYTVNQQAKEDVPGTLQRVREAGFEYVQWSGMPPMPAEDARKHLNDAGLTPIAAHCPMEPFEQDFETNAAYWKTVGVADVAPGMMMADCRDNLQAWLDGAKRLDTLGAKLRREGIRLSYHNHAMEFETFDGDDRYKLDILYQSTSAENLYAEIDTAWVYTGGVDPAAYIRQYAGRCPIIHVKDRKQELVEDNRPVFTPLGQGCLNWDDIFSASAEADVEWCVYEQDSHEGDVWENLRASYEFLKANLG